MPVNVKSNYNLQEFNGFENSQVLFMFSSSLLIDRTPPTQTMLKDNYTGVPGVDV